MELTVERIYFSLYGRFPKFCDEFYKFDMAFDEQMRRQGYKSALYHPASTSEDGELSCSYHSLSEEDYTWFALRFG